MYFLLTLFKFPDLLRFYLFGNTLADINALVINIVPLQHLLILVNFYMHFQIV